MSSARSALPQFCFQISMAQPPSMRLDQGVEQHIGEFCKGMFNYMHSLAGIYGWYTFLESRAVFCLLSKKVEYSPVVEWGERMVGFRTLNFKSRTSSTCNKTGINNGLGVFNRTPPRTTDACLPDGLSCVLFAGLARVAPCSVLSHNSIIPGGHFQVNFQPKAFNY